MKYLLDLSTKYLKPALFDAPNISGNMTFPQHARENLILLDVETSTRLAVHNVLVETTSWDNNGKNLYLTFPPHELLDVSNISGNLYYIVVHYEFIAISTIWYI